MTVKESSKTRHEILAKGGVACDYVGKAAGFDVFSQEGGKVLGKALERLRLDGVFESDIGIPIPCRMLGSPP